MYREELRAILEKHKQWLDDYGGERANLGGADLSGADLIGANLSGANLGGADLSGADLGGADLSGANLSGADLIDADLIDADLSGAKFNWTKTQDLRGQRVIAVQVDTSRPNNTISYWADLGIWTTGCFQGSLEELKEKINETHKDNEFLRERYYRVIHFILQEADEDNGRNEISR